MFAWTARLLGIRTRRGFRLFLRGIAIVVGAVSGYLIAVLIEFTLYEWSVLALAFLIAATLFEFVLGDLIAEHSYPIETEKKLALLEARLGTQAISSITDMLNRIIRKFKACDQNRISATVHLLIDLSPSAEVRTRRGLLQLTDYVGPFGGDKGRITTLDKGIIGRCARTEKREIVNFADQHEYERRMVEEFGFLRKEAESHTKSARSYLAEPIKIDGQVVGVMYFFSTEAQVFPLAARQAELSERAKDLGAILKVVALV